MKNRGRKIITFVFFSFLLSLFLFLVLDFALIKKASATPSVIPLSNATEKGKYDKGDYELNDFLVMGINVTKIILGVVGSLSLLMFIYGGFMMLISAGNTEKVSKAKGIIVSAVIGLVIVFASFLIVKFVMEMFEIDWSGTTDSITGNNVTNNSTSTNA